MCLNAVSSDFLNRPHLCPKKLLLSAAGHKLQLQTTMTGSFER